MKILAVIGSPKGKGNTYRIVKRIEEEIRNVDPCIEFEYLHLKDADLQLCQGCYLCLKSGEEHCPLKDDREAIERKMQEADGVIFTTPVYVFNLSWIMKNFIDRFAYICHRPRFHGKRAMVVSTTGGIGLKFVLFTLGFAVGTWGFTVTQKLGIICPPGEISREEGKKLEEKTKKSIRRAAQQYYRTIQGTSLRKPGIIGLISFQLQKRAFGGSERDQADYRYWKSRGWLEKETEYYYPVRSNILKKALAALLVRLWFIYLPKPPHYSR